MATTKAKPASKPAAKKAPAKKAPAPKRATSNEVDPAPPFEVTPIDDAVSIKIEDQKATLKINGTFDQDALTAVAKRVDRARAEIS